MVSVVLLTTEEGLARNSYWCHLDTLWVTVDLEPFEDVEPEHLFTKPLSRDAYYARFPEIERSESEEESSMTVAGFRNKYDQWRSKIMIRRIIKEQDRSKKSSFGNRSSRSNPSSSSDVSKISAANEIPNTKVDNDLNDKKIRDFFTRLLENIPPPPVNEVNNELPVKLQNRELSMLIVQKIDDNFNEVEVPDYDEFVNDKVLINDEASRRCSTLKRTSRQDESKHVEFLYTESWNDTIYGLPDLQLPGPSEELKISNISESLCIINVDKINKNRKVDRIDYCFDENSLDDYDYTESWSDVTNNHDYKEDESMYEPNFLYKCISQEEIVSRSHCNDLNVFDVSDSDDEKDYARFAIYKIYQSTSQEIGMPDSSSMMDLNCDDIDNIAIKSNISLMSDMYRLAPIDYNTSDSMFHIDKKN